MTGTSINISRENIAQAVENVTKLSREEIQKWRDFVNEELKKTDLDEKTKEKYQKYKAIFEKTSAQINSLQGEMPLQPIDKNTGTAPASPAKSTESQSVSVSPEQQKKQKEEIEEYGQDVAVKLAEILVKDGEINQQGIKSAMELVNDLSQLKYKDNPDLNLKLEASELDVLKKVPHAVKGVVGSVFLSSLYANGYTVRFIGNEQVSLHKHKDAPVVRLGEGTDLSHSINNFIKGNPGFLEVLKAGLLFHSGDLAKYVDTNSSYGKLNAWTHNYRSFSQYLNKRTEETLPGASMKESQDNLFSDEEFKNYLGVASVMPEDIVSVTKKLSENEKVKQLFKEWIATAGLAQTVPQAVRQTHTPEERAQIMGMHDNETWEEYQKRLKDNPGGTILDTVVVDGFVRGTRKLFEWMPNRTLGESMTIYGLLALGLGAMLFSKNRWKWLGTTFALLVGNGLWNKWEWGKEIFGEKEKKDADIPDVPDDAQINPNDFAKYVTKAQVDKKVNEFYAKETNTPEKAKEAKEFSDKFLNIPVGDIKGYYDKTNDKNLSKEWKELIDKNPENAKILRKEIAVMDESVQEYFKERKQIDKNAKIPNVTDVQLDQIYNEMITNFDKMTLEQRRNWHTMSKEQKDWLFQEKFEKAKPAMQEYVKKKQESVQSNDPNEPWYHAYGRWAWENPIPTAGLIVAAWIFKVPIAKIIFWYPIKFWIIYPINKVFGEKKANVVSSKITDVATQAAEATKEKATAAKNKITKTSSLEQGKAESYADHKNRLLETKSGLDQKITELEQQKALRTDKAGQDKIQTQINELEVKKANIDEKLSAREKIEPFPTKEARERYEGMRDKFVGPEWRNIEYHALGKTIHLTSSEALRIHQSYDYLKKFDGVSVKDPATMSEMVKHLQNIESVIREATGWELKLVEKFAKTGKVPGVSTNKITEVKFNHAVLAKLIKR